MNIIKNFLTNNRCYQRNVKIKKIGIQLHTIGTAQNTAQNVADYWNSSSASVCTNYIVDCETPGKVLYILPEGVRSWADAGWGNNNLITFEICESDFMKYTSGADYVVTDAAKFKADIMRGYNTAVELCADICSRYGWNPEAKLDNGMYLISSHDEGRRAGISSGHVDPEHIWPRFGLSMDKFRRDVKKAMNQSNTDAQTNIKGIAIGDSNVEAISKVVYGEAGIIRSDEALVAVAQCIKDMYESGRYGKTITAVMENNFYAYGTKETTDAARQAVYDVFVKGKKRFLNAAIYQFRSFTKYSDGNGNMDPFKCADLLKVYEYLGKDARDNQWGHFYFGKTIAAQEPTIEEPSGIEYKVQSGSFTNKTNAAKQLISLKEKGFDAFIREEDGQHKVQVGSYSVYQNAVNRMNEIKKMGFPAIIKEYIK